MELLDKIRANYYAKRYSMANEMARVSWFSFIILLLLKCYTDAVTWWMVSLPFAIPIAVFILAVIVLSLLYATAQVFGAVLGILKRLRGRA